MCTTPMFCNIRASLLLCVTFSALLAMALSPAHAQKKQRIQWPRTFSGQPDFDFERSEVIAEKIQKEGKEAGQTPTLEDVMSGTKLDNPFQLEELTDANAPTLAKDIDFDAEDDTIQSLEELSSFELKAAQLPSVQAQTKLVDLSDFKAFLEGVIEKTIKNTKPNLEEINPNALLGRMLLQAISHSPQQYVIINQKRYKEGSQFYLPWTITPSNDSILKVLHSHLPSKEAITPETYALYEALLKETMNTFISHKKTSLESYQVTHPIPVTIKRIKHRKVVVELLGKEHDLHIRFTL